MTEEEIREQLGEIDDWIASATLPSEISLNQFSYMLYQLSLSYGISGEDLAECASAAFTNLALAAARRTTH
jgi:hypothetical protein